MLAAAQPYPQYFDLDGSPLDGGAIYYGTADADPESSPITVYWDAAGTQPAAQPIATLNGFPVNGSTPAAVYVSGDYSLRTRNRQGVQVLYCASAQTANNSLALQSQIDGFSSTAAGKGAAMVGYMPPGTGAVARTVGDKLGQLDVCAFDYMTDAQIADVLSSSPTVDMTAAINAATLAAAAFSDNATAPKRRIRLPAGNWRIDGPVYVRKGQELVGDGIGATRIVQDPSKTTSIFVLGSGAPGGSETQDAGGLPPAISGLHIHSSSATAPAIRTSAAGALLADLFLTNVGVGISIQDAGDVTISRCFFDQGLTGISFSNSQNVIVSDCLFYLLNYGVQVGSNTRDVQVDNCHFEYQKWASVQFNDGATGIRNFSVTDCQFLLNEQHGTFLGFVHSRTGDADVHLSGCKFRNMKGYAITFGNGSGADFTVSQCAFDGLKTASGYSQSTTAGGIQPINARVRAFGNVFRNLNLHCIDIGGSLSPWVDVQGGTYNQISGATAINVGASNGLLRVSGVMGDGVTPLVNAQAAVPVQIKGCIDWLGAAQISSGRRWWRVPFTTDGLLANVTVTANTNAAGDARYRRSKKAAAAKGTYFSGGALKDAVSVSTLADSPDDAPSDPIALYADIGAVLGGQEAAHSTAGGWMVLSVPDSYTNVALSVDFD